MKLTPKEEEIIREFVGNPDGVIARGQTVRTKPRKLLAHRPKGTRHPWRIDVGPDFMSDLDALQPHIRDCVVQNIASMCMAERPNNTYINDWLMACDVGLGFHIIYEVKCRYHTIILFFVRMYGTSNTPLRVAYYPPLEKDEGYDSFCGLVRRAHTRDVYVDDLRLKLGEKKCGV